MELTATCSLSSLNRRITLSFPQPFSAPLRAVGSPPPLSCPRCAPPARRRPCPVPATRCPLAAALVLSPLRVAHSPPPLSCLRCAPSARRRPCPVPAVHRPLAAVPVFVLSATGSPPDSAPSQRWLTVPTHRSAALILHAGLLLLRVARLTLFLLTYIRTFGRNTMLGIGGLHLVRVARLPSLSLLANISYRLLVGPHSPSWPTAPTRCSFDLVFADLHSDLWQKRHVLHRWPTSRTCCSFVLIRRAGPLVRLARPPSFSLLAYLSYAFRICSHSPLPTARKHCSSALILPLFSSLAYILYALLVCPYAPPYVPRTSRLDLGCWTLYHNVYIYFK